MTWAVASAPVGGAEAEGILLAYYADIVGRYYRRVATRDEVRAAMAAEPSAGLTPPEGRFLLGRYDGEVAGCVGVRLLEPGMGELARVYVRPELRGTGGGAALLGAAEAAARELGATVLRLDTRADLVEARALYAAHGYQEIPAYHDGPYADHFFEKALR
ncbi:GNAT family N-acetyltransferase [Streptomyces sp. WMMC897]|uniref:GNAT family N-acetyltransferase n=1 Tax=Streptomyces sp. WMMC897 TaxID=3014782 RepID=UPI0022B750ED|nr:GNAT family N-acetyltransferase [Streptomyces sp. WMMC897]MCZ7416589.1 GNAT family N-acetyltransferase [Streptomyces sp. WMMC897]